MTRRLNSIQILIIIFIIVGIIIFSGCGCTQRSQTTTNPEGAGGVGKADVGNEGSGEKSHSTTEDGKVSMESGEKKVEVETKDANTKVSAMGEDGSVSYETDKDEGKKIVAEPDKKTGNGEEEKEEAVGRNREKVNALKIKGNEMEIEVEDEKGERVKIKGYKEGEETGEVVVEGKHGRLTQKVNKGLSKAELGVPLYPGAAIGNTINEDIDGTDGKKLSNQVVTMTTNDSVRAVKDFYARKLPGAEVISNEDGETVINQANAGNPMEGITITIAKEEDSGKTEVVITKRRVK